MNNSWERKGQSVDDLCQRNDSNKGKPKEDASTSLARSFSDTLALRLLYNGVFFSK